MNEHASFERFLADQFADAEGVAPPAHSVDHILTEARRMRPLPRWLALIKEPPMRISSRVAVGSPMARVAYLVILVMILTALTASGVVVGATLLASPAPGPAAACSSGPGRFELGPEFEASRLAVTLSDGRVLLGRGETADLALFDPATSTIRPAGAQTVADAMDAIRLEDGRVLFLPSYTTRPADVWDPSNETVTQTGSPLVARSNTGGTLLADGRVLVVGGNIDAGGDTSVGAFNAEIWDPGTGVFTAVSRLAGINPETATVLKDGRVLLVGTPRWSPFDPAETPATPSAMTWDPVSGTLEATDGGPSVWRSGFKAIRLVDGRVLIVGGMDWSGRPIPEAELYDPVTDAFTPAGALAAARFWFAATLLGNGRVLVLGGITDESTYNPVLGSEIWDPATGVFIADAALAQGRVYPGAVLLADCSVVIVGGGIFPEPGRPVERWVPGA